MDVCCECCVLLDRGLCDGLITRPEESYRLWRVVVCDQETSNSRRLKLANGLWKIQPQWVVTPRKQTTNKHNVVNEAWAFWRSMQRQQYGAAGVKEPQPLMCVFIKRFESILLQNIFVLCCLVNFNYKLMSTRPIFTKDFFLSRCKYWITPEYIFTLLLLPGFDCYNARALWSWDHSYMKNIYLFVVCDYLSWSAVDFLMMVLRKPKYVAN